jgi:hypothetical protein
MNGEMNRTSDNMQMVTVCNVPAPSSSCSTDSLEIFSKNENDRLDTQWRIMEKAQKRPNYNVRLDCRHH